MDGAYRLTQGQLPHLDFITPIGLWGYVLPFLGLKITGSYTLMLPLTDLIFMAIALGLCLAAAWQRLGTLSGLLLVTYVWLVSAAPLNAGDTANYISYSMFYNRYGWALLLVVFTLYIDPQSTDKKKALSDVCVGAIALVMLLYLKVSYFAVVLAFLAMLCLKSKYHRKVAFYCFLILAVCVISLELIMPGLNLAYFHDLRLALQSSGAVRGGKYAAINFIYKNLFELLLISAVIWFSTRIIKFRLLDACFVSYVTLSSCAILNQNAQNSNLVALFPICLWAMEKARSQSGQAVGNQREGSAKGNGFAYAGLVALSVLLLAQPFLDRAYGLVIMNARSRPMAQSRPMALDKLPNAYVYKDSDYISGIDRDSYGLAELFTIRERQRRGWLAELEYVETIEDGVALLKKNSRPGDSVAIMDMVNPFNFLLDLHPPRGAYSFFHLNRTFNLAKARPKPAALAEASLVMIPNYPIELAERNALLQIFAPVLRRDFAEAARDRYWTLLRRKTPS
ncbi:hypothetical protein AAU61_15535 [Desulfocarbo indianensis]|nr:hypothetical protein AAU61_15535 [Desulfocarbo indianensis]